MSDKCPKCGQSRGHWKTVWFADIGGSVEEWVPHECPEESSEETVATSEGE